MTLEHQSLKKEKPTKESLDLSANLNKCCKIDIYNLNKITVFNLGGKSFRQKY